MKRIIIFISIVVISLLVYKYWDNTIFIKRGETKILTLKTNKKITIKLSENESTGYQNCWINKNNCTRIKLTKSFY